MAHLKQVYICFIASFLFGALFQLQAPIWNLHDPQRVQKPIDMSFFIENFCIKSQQKILPLIQQTQPLPQTVLINHENIAPVKQLKLVNLKKRCADENFDPNCEAPKRFRLGTDTINQDALIPNDFLSYYTSLNEDIKTRAESIKDVVNLDPSQWIRLEDAPKVESQEKSSNLNSSLALRVANWYANGWNTFRVLSGIEDPNTTDSEEISENACMWKLKTNINIIPNIRRFKLQNTKEYQSSYLAGQYLSCFSKMYELFSKQMIQLSESYSNIQLTFYKDEAEKKQKITEFAASWFQALKKIQSPVSSNKADPFSIFGLNTDDSYDKQKIDSAFEALTSFHKNDQQKLKELREAYTLVKEPFAYYLTQGMLKNCPIEKLLIHDPKGEKRAEIQKSINIIFKMKVAINKAQQYLKDPLVRQELVAKIRQPQE